MARMRCYPMSLRNGYTLIQWFRSSQVWISIRDSHIIACYIYNVLVLSNFVVCSRGSPQSRRLPAQEDNLSTGTFGFRQLGKGNDRAY